MNDFVSTGEQWGISTSAYDTFELSYSRGKFSSIFIGLLGAVIIGFINFLFLNNMNFPEYLLTDKARFIIITMALGVVPLVFGIWFYKMRERSRRAVLARYFMDNQHFKVSGRDTPDNHKKNTSVSYHRDQISHFELASVGEANNEGKRRKDVFMHYGQGQLVNITSKWTSDRSASNEEFLEALHQRLTRALSRHHPTRNNQPEFLEASGIIMTTKTKNDAF